MDGGMIVGAGDGDGKITNPSHVWGSWE